MFFTSLRSLAVPLDAACSAGRNFPIRARSADSRRRCASSSRMSFFDSGRLRAAASSAPNRTMEGSIWDWNVASSSWTSSHRLDRAVIAFHVADRCSPKWGSYVPSSSPRILSVSSSFWGTTIRWGAHRSRGSRRTFIPEKCTSHETDEEPPVTASSRGGWGQCDLESAIFARGCTTPPSSLTPLASASPPPAASSGPAHSEDSIVVRCANREAWTTLESRRRRVTSAVGLHSGSIGSFRCAMAARKRLPTTLITNDVLAACC
mmetsp:Transcript_25260/g.53786  ORF Transcript_25260/g.53786 Transcript_25260/m.53786 type:complete len:263 (-) Transcript_25260:166-954(-)